MSGLYVSDELNLDLNTNIDSKSILNRSAQFDDLNNQIRQLKDENGRLFKLVAEKDMHLKNLKKKREDNNILKELPQDMTSETAGLKIVELSKKIRDLNAELEKERYKNLQTMRKNKELETQLVKSDNLKSKKSRFEKESDPLQKAEVEIIDLSRKVKDLEMKLVEVRTLNSTLKQDLKVAHKIISNEVGEGVNVQDLIRGQAQNNGSVSSWRGRSQQILALQKKVHELKASLEQTAVENELSEEMKKDLGLNQVLCRFSPSAGSTTSRRTVDLRQKEIIRHLERERKEQAEKSAQQLEILEADFESLKKKFEASKSRTKNLSTESKALRQRNESLVMKTKHDNELIDALTKHNEKLQSMLKVSDKQIADLQKKENEASHKVEENEQKHLNLIEQLQSIIKEKDSLIDQLECDMSSVPSQKNPNNVPIKNSSNGQNSPLSVDSISPISLKPNTNIKDINEDRDKETTNYHKEKTTDIEKTSKMMTYEVSNKSVENIALIESLEQKDLLYQATIVEKDKLFELVQVHQKRIDELQNELLATQTHLQNERAKNAMLEKQQSRASLPDGKSDSGKKSRDRKSTIKMSSAKDDKNNGRHNILYSSRLSNSESPSLTNRTNHPNTERILSDGHTSKLDSMIIDELESQLDILRDENASLKIALANSVEQKGKDLEMYRETIEATKDIFIQDIKNKKKEHEQTTISEKENSQIRKISGKRNSAFNRTTRSAGKR